MRGRGMKRCRAEGAERFALFVGAAVLANNLMILTTSPATTSPGRHQSMPENDATRTGKFSNTALT
jgi:IS5 family transposase